MHRVLGTGEIDPHVMPHQKAGLERLNMRVRNPETIGSFGPQLEIQGRLRTRPKPLRGPGAQSRGGALGHCVGGKPEGAKRQAWPGLEAQRTAVANALLDAAGIVQFDHLPVAALQRFTVRHDPRLSHPVRQPQSPENQESKTAQHGHETSDSWAAGYR